MKVILISFLCFFSLPFIPPALAQNVTLSGQVKSSKDKSILPYVNILLKRKADSTLVQGTISNEDRISGSGNKSKKAKVNYLLTPTS